MLWLYSARPLRIVRQILSDIFVIVWAAVCWHAGDAVSDAFAAGADRLRGVASSTTKTSQDLGTMGHKVENIPIVGKSFSTPFTASSSKLEYLSKAIVQETAAIEHAAAWAGWLVFALPVAIATGSWLVLRVRFVARAYVVSHSMSDDMLALQALAQLPPGRLARATRRVERHKKRRAQKAQQAAPAVVAGMPAGTPVEMPTAMQATVPTGMQAGMQAAPGEMPAAMPAGTPVGIAQNNEPHEQVQETEPTVDLADGWRNGDPKVIATLASLMRREYGILFKPE